MIFLGLAQYLIRKCAKSYIQNYVIHPGPESAPKIKLVLTRSLNLQIKKAKNIFAASTGATCWPPLAGRTWSCAEIFFLHP